VLKLIIEDDEGRKTVVPFVREEITIGRQEGNTIRLTERNVSRRHARLLRQNGHVVVEDLGSSNGTRINGERISGQSSVKDGDLIQIGDYDLAVQSEAAAAAGPPTARMRPAPSPKDEPSDPDGGSEPETETETPVQEDEANASPSAAEQRRHSTAIIRMDHVESTRSRRVEELEPEDAPRLVVVSSELKGQEYACIRTELKIGRTDDNDIVIDHRSLSRTHAKIVREENGEWRIIDMQSANGLTVNGETYAQASLASGDVIELGHVKLRFVAAGETAAALDSPGRSKLPLVLALVVLLLGGGVGAMFAMKVGPFKADPGPGPGPNPNPNPPELTTNKDPQPTEPQDTPPQTPKPPPETPKPPDKPDPEALAAEARKELEARMASSEKALLEGNFEKAADDLKPLQTGDKWPEQVQPLVDRIEKERQVEQFLNDAQKAFAEKKYDEAELLLVDAAETRVKRLADKRDKLAAELAQARKNEPPKPPTVTPKPKPPSGPSLEEQAQTAFTDAADLFRKKQYQEARNMASKCLELTPDNADCHLVMGSSWAGDKDYEKAAQYYRSFLKLAPNHKTAPKVKEALENYEKKNPPN
jgi:pSer/pThr/pTyr-binding forkhead associated (FHA) protein/TolA-binding protein